MYSFVDKISVNKLGINSDGKCLLETRHIEQPELIPGGLCKSEIDLIKDLFTNVERENRYILVALNCPDRSYIQDVSWRRIVRHFNIFLGRLAEAGFEICFRDKPGWESMYQYFDPTKLGAEALSFNFKDQRDVDIEHWALVYFPFGPSTFADEFKNDPSVMLLSSGFRAMDFLDDIDFGTFSSVANKTIMTTIDELDRIVTSVDLPKSATRSK
jgi:hypothetical protein